MIFNDLFVIRNEKNSEYKNNFSSEIKITSYTHKRISKEWKETVNLCSEPLYMMLSTKFSMSKLYFWICYRFNKAPTRLEQYKGILNDKKLNFLRGKSFTYSCTHNTANEFGCSALIEVSNVELFSDALNYLRDSNEGFLFFGTDITDFENFDKAIYSYHKDFSLLVQLVENKNFAILRPYGSFDDRDFCIEIYEKENHPNCDLCGYRLKWS